MKKSNKKILLLSYRLGYDSLLYWDKMLSGIKESFLNFKVFTAWPSLKTKNNLVITEEKLKGIKYYHNKDKINQRLIYIPLPFFIIDVLKYKPDIIILNEFNLVNLYIVIFKFLYKNTKLMLLVESDPGLGNTLFKKKTIRYFYRKFIVKNVDLIQTNNQLGMKYLTNYLDIESTKIKVAPYLTSSPDKSVLKITRNMNNFAQIKFLYVGQLVERKGLIFFFESLKSLPTSIKKLLQVDIIGTGNLESELQNFVKKENLDFIHFHGKLQFEELSEYYHFADCFVLPTLHDYRALVGFEALSYGCAIIDSIYNGARFEAVEENYNGFIIDPRNIKEFQFAISKIVENKELRELFKLNSLKKSLQFTYEQCNKNITTNIIGLLNEK